MDDTAQQPVSGPQKEQEPIAGRSYIEQVERAPEIPPEVAQVGVAPISQTAPLTKEDREAGIIEAGEAVPTKTEPEGLVNLPLTEQEARSALRIHKNIKEAIVWLANFVLRQFRIFQ
ncbi:hypothetical protein HYW66_00050, partial [Candidatus Microgenomates bacterium]|nr:hypothetical protein [Candidatus Microgenomates bacterium]